VLTQRQSDSIDEQRRPPDEAKRIERFISALSQAMAVKDCSQRRLAALMGVESGTFTKYYQGRVDPFKIGTGIQKALATVLGVTVDSLIQYYESGSYCSGVGAVEVRTWISSEADRSDLVEILAALQSAGERWQELSVALPSQLAPFPWPQELIEQLELPPALRERMGVGAAALEVLVQKGEYDEYLVNGFALATGLSADVVRSAFQERRPAQD
jgi:hypothetical protein